MGGRGVKEGMRGEFKVREIVKRGQASGRLERSFSPILLVGEKNGVVWDCRWGSYPGQGPL